MNPLYEKYRNAVENNLPASSVIPNPFRDVSDPRNGLSPPYMKPANRRLLTTPTPPTPVGGENPNPLQRFYNHYQNVQYGLEDKFGDSIGEYIDTSPPGKNGVPSEGYMAALLRLQGKGDIVDKYYLGLDDEHLRKISGGNRK